MSWRSVLGLKPTESQFAANVLARFRRAGVTGDITYDPVNFCLVLSSLQTTHYLTSHYQEICRAWPWKRSAHSNRLVASLIAHAADKPLTASEAIPRLLPTIRNPLHFETIELHRRKENKPVIDCPRESLAGFLNIALVIDHKDSMSVVKKSDLDRWQLTFEQAMAIALTNLEQISAQPMKAIGYGLYRTPWGDNHDAGRLLLPDYLRRLPCSGDWVAMVPNRDCLLLTDSANDDGLRAMAMAGVAEGKHSRPISPVVFTCHDGVWSPFRCHDGPPGARALDALCVDGLSYEYNQQKGLLEALHAITGEDVFVASLATIIAKGQNPRTLSTWTKGIPTYLPTSDLIFLIDPDLPDDQRMLGIFSWGDVQALGSTFTPIGMTPERWMTGTFPSTDQLKGLTKRLNRS